MNDNYADEFGYNQQDQFVRDPGRGNKLLGMSSRQQVKYLMQKTQKEAGWDMDNDSDLKGGSGKFYSHGFCWQQIIYIRHFVILMFILFFMIF